jgi:Holliday junction resolvase
MSNPSKQKGTRAETKVVRYLQSCGFTARRQALAGSDDQGDIEAIAPSGDKFIIEVKAGKQTAAPNRSQIESWCEQAMTEANNAGGKPALVIVRYNRSLWDADVYMPRCYHEREHMFLSDWALRYS